VGGGVGWGRHVEHGPYAARQSDVDGAIGDNFVADAPAGNRAERGGVELPPNAGDRDASARPVQREERHDRVGRQRQRGLAWTVQDVDMLLAPPRIDHRYRCQLGKAEGAERGKRVVEPVAAADHGQPSGHHVGNKPKCKFGVGVVLVCWVARDRGVLFGPREAVGAHRVEVADQP